MLSTSVVVDKLIWQFKHCINMLEIALKCGQCEQSLACQRHFPKETERSLFVVVVKANSKKICLMSVST